MKYLRIPTLKEIRDWWVRFPVEGNGMPTSVVAHNVINYLFVNRKNSIKLDDMAIDISQPPELLEVMCKQLRMIDIVKQVGLSEFQYDLHCKHVKLQADIEYWLAVVPFSPSDNY